MAHVCLCCSQSANRDVTISRADSCRERETIGLPFYFQLLQDTKIAVQSNYINNVPLPPFSTDMSTGRNTNDILLQEGLKGRLRIPVEIYLKVTCIRQIPYLGSFFIYPFSNLFDISIIQFQIVFPRLTLTMLIN